MKKIKIKRKSKGLKTHLDFKFEIDDEIIPDLNYEVPLKPKGKKGQINIVNIKRNARDSSTNSKLF